MGELVQDPPFLLLGPRLFLSMSQRLSVRPPDCGLRGGCGLHGRLQVCSGVLEVDNLDGRLSPLFSLMIDLKLQWALRGQHPVAPCVALQVSLCALASVLS